MSEHLREMMMRNYEATRAAVRARRVSDDVAAWTVALGSLRAHRQQIREKIREGD